MSKRKALLILDPMCSWTYGFMLNVEKYAEKYDLELMCGGLSPFETEVKSKESCDDSISSWKDLAAHFKNKLGYDVEFDYAFFDKHPGYIPDTAPADKAVVACYRMDHAKALKFVKLFQIDFYQHSADPTKYETFVKNAVAAGFTQEAFEKAYAAISDEDLQKEFDRVNELPYDVFPTLLVKKFLGKGYKPVDVLKLG